MRVVRHSILAGCVLVWASAPAWSQNSPPQAEDDLYATGVDQALSVDPPGVLENDDDPDGNPLTAVLVDMPESGGLVTLLPDGSFEYEPTGGYSGTDSFTYQAFDGVALSNLATVEVTVSPGQGGLDVYLDEAGYLAALATLGLDATSESFEDDQIWGAVRSTISGGNFTASSVTGLGVRWTANNDVGEVTTGPGPARIGMWGFFTLPHGDYLTGTGCQIPGNCTDGFVGSSAPALYGVGGWFTGFFGSKLEIILDGSRVADFGNGGTLTGGYTFLGVVDPNGFHSFEFHELEGTIDDAKYIFADDFTFGTSAGVTLSVIRGTGPQDVALQWLGSQPDFDVHRSNQPGIVLDPANNLGQTASRVWMDTPPAGSIYYYKVVPVP